MSNDEYVPDGGDRTASGTTYGRRPFLKGAGTLAAAGAFLGGFVTEGGATTAADAQVPDRTPDRTYDVSAISLNIPFSQTGLHQPNGAMFVLDENKEDVRAVEDLEAGSDPRTRLIEPLVVRANEGEVVEIRLTNELDQHVSMHQTGLPYDVQTSDGMAVGFNEDTTVAPGETISYQWHANRLGTFFFHDGATSPYDSMPDGNPGNINGFARGLFGAMVVEPEEAEWTDPRNGEPLPSGTRANILLDDDDEAQPGIDHREFVVFYHDPQGVVTEDGGHFNYPGTDEEQHVHGINYRAATTGGRFDEDDPDLKDDADPVTFYSSWVHGDPGGGDTVFEAYTGDPTKFVAVGAQLEENHVHHIHGHRWQEGQFPEGGEETDTIDAQTIGPGATYEAYLTAAYGDDSSYPDRDFEEAFDIGAGGTHQAPGDYLFHCHLFPHYGEGMNAIFRVNDKVKDDLVELPNNRADDDDDDNLYPADSDRPSWQELVGTTIDEEGEAPAKPPGQGREPTAEEEEHLTPLVDGAPYVDPCIEEEVKRTVEYETVALFSNIVYNDSGDHDPDGRIFMAKSAKITEHREDGDVVVLDQDYSEDVQKVRDGEMNPEPLVLRANVGDCIEVTLTNELPQDASHHIHFVSYDPLGSDSTMVGYNYDSGTDPGESRTYRWFADEEGTIFMHDHMVGVEFGQHGTFSTLLVEPEGSEWLDPYSGEPMTTGAQAMIDPPEAEAFREQALIYHDFAPLKDRDGNFVNNNRQHAENAGVMAINYRNSPYFHRDDADPAYVFSSARHGDPETPVLEAYDGDPIRIRLVQGAWEEQHNFSMHGLRLDRQGLTDAGSTAQIIGTSEAFTLGTVASRIPQDLSENENDEVLTDPNLDVLMQDTGGPMPNPNGLPVTDFLYGSTIDEDLWTGMWGITRVWGDSVSHLQPLPGNAPPPGRITDLQLRQMGHPAPFADFSRARYGQKAKLYYAEDDDRTFPADKDARQNNSVGRVPPKAPSPGWPCEDDVPIRTYDVCALRTDIQYNEYGDHDPDGIVYALESDVNAIRYGGKNPEPLIIRANEGDCIELTLKNRIEPPEDDHFQADLIVGKPETVLGEDLMDFYGPEGRLARYAHGTTDDGVVRQNVSWIADREKRRCISSSEITTDLEEQTASVEVTIAEDCEGEIELSFAMYRKPSAPAQFDAEAHQHLVDAETRTLGPGTHTFTVDLPEPTHPLPRANAPWEESLRMSMHPHKLRYDAQGSDGATVGFNYDQTVAPGEEITYRWYADDEFGSLVLWDMADTRSHWHHGAFGKLIVEPEGSAYLNPETGGKLRQGAGDSAMIVSPERTFREFALLMSDGMDIINPTGECVVPIGEEDLVVEDGGEDGGELGEEVEDGEGINVVNDQEDPDGGDGDEHGQGHPNHQPCNQIGDPEDHGYVATNYRSEPFRYRLEDDDRIHKVYSSDVHGDPNTPVFKALQGEPVVFRASQAGTKARGISLHLSDHHWPRYMDTENPPVVGVDDRFIPGRSIDLYIEGGAGGTANSAGDFLYREMKEDRRTEGGLWGIFRVLVGGSDPTVKPLPEDVGASTAAD
ncbi:multicopper oxidase domain-containing protein [Halomarina litorea]|uniref:multicopper oxidase domain-containing protein n=1 Tax=Halomarina litorea TaxID=2961595 RepID=UPI0020C4E054|nr:multicopper oxidase domain-containing protein [Halomarina sp. BCD28]